MKLICCMCSGSRTLATTLLQPSFLAKEAIMRLASSLKVVAMRIVIRIDIQLFEYFYFLGVSMDAP